MDVQIVDPDTGINIYTDEWIEQQRRNEPSSTYFICYYYPPFQEREAKEGFDTVSPMNRNYKTLDDFINIHNNKKSSASLIHRIYDYTSQLWLTKDEVNALGLDIQMYSTKPEQSKKIDDNVIDDQVKSQFKRFKGTDADYILICKNSIYGNTSQNIIPLEDYWDNVEGAIKWHFEHGYDIVEIYDLYSPVETSLVKQVSKTDI